MGGAECGRCAERGRGTGRQHSPVVLGDRAVWKGGRRKWIEGKGRGKEGRKGWERERRGGGGRVVGGDG